MRGDRSGSSLSIAEATTPRARIFTACHGTQLLVIQHLRRHLERERAREFLLWYPMDRSERIDEFMSSIIEEAAFDGVFDLRRFESLQVRGKSPAAWWFEAARRSRADSESLRRWMKSHDIEERESELWADDPIHFNVIFAKSCLGGAWQVKIPHSFNLEDRTCCEYKSGLEEKSHAVSTAKRLLFWPWLRLTSGCDFRTARIFSYDVAYSFDQPSCWATKAVDVSQMISAKAFQETFHTLPATLRREVDSDIAPIVSSQRPRLLLLLFGLTTEVAEEYRRSLLRIFAERASLLKGCALAIKVHPGSAGSQEERFIAWARSSLPADVFPIRTLVNLEFMLEDIAPDYVLAGPCGALPIVQRLGIGVPVVLPEILSELCRTFPADSGCFRTMIEGMEVW